MTKDRQRHSIHASVFAALSNPTRHALVHHLCDAARTPSQLADLLAVSRPNVSQHLAVLQREGLVRRDRRDGHVFWEIVNPRLREMCDLVDEILGPELASRAAVFEQTTSAQRPSQAAHA